MFDKENESEFSMKFLSSSSCWTFFCLSLPEENQLFDQSISTSKNSFDRCGRKSNFAKKERNFFCHEEEKKSRGKYFFPFPHVNFYIVGIVGKLPLTESGERKSNSICGVSILNPLISVVINSPLT